MSQPGQLSHGIPPREPIAELSRRIRELEQRLQQMHGSLSQAINGNVITTDFVPVGTTGYTIGIGRSGERVYNSTNGNAVIFASKLDADAFPRQYIFADPEAGIFWSDGTVDANTSSGFNIFLWDNSTIALSGQLRAEQVNMIGKDLFWNAIDRTTKTAPGSSLGDPTTDGTAPNAVGVNGYSTADRNTLGPLITATGDHYMVFDTDLHKPIWSDGAGGWVDATGASV